MLEDVSVFDVYTGGQVGEGRRSLALALTFQSSERTLTDEDVTPARERIVAALAELGGELRG
jgi:phenylalanyl-tRNA synthetase beta chain